ncbi:MAG: NAD-dependent epimerase/dehydratase family protein [Acidobacteriota bacterium]|nr:NAD-dependent epimerase/dehydratase family protein [Acidobacteriota bacterium]
MSQGKTSVLVTGAAGNLGLRLLPQLADFAITAVDLARPATSLPLRFERMDLGEEAACKRLVRLLRESGATAVVHLGFVIDPQRTGILDRERMWQINVAGTARVLEAITEINRSGGAVNRFIYPSSVAVYGPDLPLPVDEDFPLGGHTLTYAVHKREADEAVRARFQQLGGCSVYLLRPHIFAGATMENYLIGGFRGTPSGRGRIASWMRQRRWRLPFIVPWGRKYLENRFQFVHVDDVARLMAHLLRRPQTDAEPALTVLNVAGRGEALPLERCLALAGTKAFRLPGYALCRMTLSLLWKLGVCAVPPDALPYIAGSYTMDTHRLRDFLGDAYPEIIRYTIEQALVDSFREAAGSPQPAAGGQAPVTEAAAEKPLTVDSRR